MSEYSLGNSDRMPAEKISRNNGFDDPWILYNAPAIRLIGNIVYKYIGFHLEK